MKISEFEKQLADFRQEHGDLNIFDEYYCESCHEFHEGQGIQFDLVDGQLRFRARKFGD